MIKKIENFYLNFNTFLGKMLAVLLMLMIVNVFYDVVSRYAFNSTSVALQEFEWHLFAVIILFGMSYTLLENAHVRVDFIYEKFSLKKQALVNIIGTVLFLFPLSFLIIFGSYEFVYDAYSMNEISGDPGGLAYRWVIKAMIPLGFGVLVFSALGYIVQNISIYKGLNR